ncbi:MAG TPA: transcriptional regulator [Streptosporangiaceae bacterium]|nr:transcriptional regulator [Streptosporangiaceae bacterium]
MTGTHPRHDLDDLLTHPVRLSIVAALAGVERAEFALIRDSLEVSDSMLSKQIALLEAAGYVEVEKGRVGRRTRTWLSITSTGDEVYRRHIHALRAIAGLDPQPGHAPAQRRTPIPRKHKTAIRGAGFTNGQN